MTINQKQLDLLAEFAEGKWEHAQWMFPYTLEDGRTYTRYCVKRDFRPHSLDAPAWQRQILLDAVKGKGERFITEFLCTLSNNINGSERVNNAEAFNCIAAHPEVICTALIEIIEEGEA